MSSRSFRQIRKSIARSMRTLSVALLVASVLLGLLPPPLVTSVATHIAPAPLEAEVVEAAKSLADALPEAATASAAPVAAPSNAELNAPLAAPALQVAPPTFVAAETSTVNNGTAITITVPAGAAVGDVLIGVISIDDDSNDPLTAPTGWTLIRLGNGGSDGPTLVAYYRLVDGTEAASYTFLWSAGEQAAGAILLYRGADPRVPINVTSTMRTGEDTSYTAPDVTTTVTNTTVIRVVATDDSNSPITHPPGTTERVDIDSSASTLGVADATQAAAGATGTASFSDPSEPWATLTMALQPRQPEGTITIVKNTDGTDGTFTFTSTDADLDAVSILTAGGTGASTTYSKIIGPYFITEDTLAGWGITNITISGDTDGGSSSSGSRATIDLDEGEEIVVTFTNGALVACGTNADDLGGTIWRDNDSDGVLDAGEPGFSTAAVTAYDNNGLVGTAPISSDGTYNFANIFNGRTGDDAHIRLEFSGLPGWAQNSVAGSNSGTTVQRHSAATCAADLGVSSQCGANPSLATSCFVIGDPLPAGSAVADYDTLVSFNYDKTGLASVGTAAETGTIWGLAYDLLNDRLFSAAMLKRHVGMGPDGPGAIYVSDPSSAAPTLFYDLAAHVSVGTIPANPDRNLDPEVGDVSHDIDAFGLIGKASLGDLDIARDSNTLYVVNLHDRLVYAIALDAPTAAPTPLPPFPDPGCNLGVARPWALKYDNSELYLGVTCTAENGGARSDLSAHVYKYDGASWSSSLLSFALDFQRGCADWQRAGSVPRCQWNPWLDDWLSYPGPGYPQPILSDIEFDDDGSMILGFIDRAGHQFGHFNYEPDLTTTDLVRVNSGGDILRAYNNSGTFEIESNGIAGPLASSGTNTTSRPWDGAGGVGSQQGPGGGEFYWQEAADGHRGNFIPLQNESAQHSETSLGGLALLPGSGEVVLSSMDPNTIDSGGVAWFSNTDGSRIDGLTLYRGANGAGYLGKAAGIGDVELICSAPPPLEIGNYVWLDDDGDGIQDPCEEPIPSVTVTLYDITGTLIASAETDSNGEYYFISGDDPRLEAGGIYETVPISVGVVPTTTIVGGLLLYTDYEIRIDTTQAAVADYKPTIANVASGTSLPDGVDSDGILSGINAVISLTTGDAGENDHTFDFGFTLDRDYGDLPDADGVAGTNSPNYNTNVATTIGASHVITPGLYLGNLVDSESNGQPSIDATGDDTITGATGVGTGVGTADDEDGITLPSVTVGSTIVTNAFAIGETATITASVVHTAAGSAYLYAFIDWNGDGDFGDTSEAISATVSSAVASQELLLTVSVPIIADTSQSLGARFRLSTDTGLGADGAATDGEVEDYLIDVISVDYGDLPDADGVAGTNSPNYNTNSTTTAGASHVIVPGLYIGASVDFETDGQPDAAAAGDDTTDTPDDEDGITFPTFTRGESATIAATVVNTSGSAAILYGFIDWNGDGDFTGTDESVTVSVPNNTNGSVSLSVNVPSDADYTQQLGARFRLSTDSGLTADGAATNGEVEDYLITVEPPDPIVSLTKTAVAPADGLAAEGETVTYALRIENTGEVTVTQVTLTDTFDPNYLTYGSSIPAETSTTANTITWTGVDGDGGSLDGNLPLAPSGVFTVTVNFTATIP